MMLGAAYQLGLIPVSTHSIAWAIKDSIRREFRKNLKAFNIGRKLALEPRALPNKPMPETWGPPTDYYEMMEKVTEARARQAVESAVKRLKEAGGSLRVSGDVVRGLPREAILH